MKFIWVPRECLFTGGSTTFRGLTDTSADELSVANQDKVLQVKAKVGGGFEIGYTALGDLGIAGNGVTTFTALTDTDAIAEADRGKFLRVKSDVNEVEFKDFELFEDVNPSTGVENLNEIQGKLLKISADGNELVPADLPAFTAASAEDQLTVDFANSAINKMLKVGDELTINASEDVKMNEMVLQSNASKLITW